MPSNDDASEGACDQSNDDRNSGQAGSEDSAARSPQQPPARSHEASGDQHQPARRADQPGYGKGYWPGATAWSSSTSLW